MNHEKYVQIHNGNIVLDRIGFGKKLQDNVCRYSENLPKKSRHEKQHGVECGEKKANKKGAKNLNGFLLIIQQKRYV